MGKMGKIRSKLINMAGMSTTCLLVTGWLQISSKEYPHRDLLHTTYTCFFPSWSALTDYKVTKVRSTSELHIHYMEVVFFKRLLLCKTNSLYQERGDFQLLKAALHTHFNHPLYELRKIFSFSSAFFVTIASEAGFTTINNGFTNTHESSSNENDTA